MWFILFTSFCYIIPAIAAKSLRSKLIYFVNATMITWVMIDSSKPFIEQAYLGNAERVSFIKAISLVTLALLSIFYLIYGLVRLYKRRGDFKKIFSKHHKLDFKDHFSGELNGEEKAALIASLPGIFIAFIIVIMYLLQDQ